MQYDAYLSLDLLVDEHNSYLHGVDGQCPNCIAQGLQLNARAICVQPTCLHAFQHLHVRIHVMVVMTEDCSIK